MNMNTMKNRVSLVGPGWWFVGTKQTLSHQINPQSFDREVQNITGVLCGSKLEAV